MPWQGQRYACAVSPSNSSASSPGGVFFRIPSLPAEGGVLDVPNVRLRYLHPCRLGLRKNTPPGDPVFFRRALLPPKGAYFWLRRRCPHRTFSTAPGPSPCRLALRKNTPRRDAVFFRRASVSSPPPNSNAAAYLPQFFLPFSVY
jgi:hypothetical protein